MGGVSDKGLFEAGPWPRGINNLAEEDQQPVDENGARLSLREADNVDLTKAGWPRRRNGYELALAGSISHSLWSTDGLPWGLFVDDGFLCTLDLAEQAESLNVEVGGHPVSYELINDRVFYTNRTHCGMVSLDGQVMPWAPEHPAGQPHAAAAPGYSLPAGLYQVAVTFTDSLGRESGCTAGVAIEVAAGDAIELTHIPVPAGVATVNVYVTDANDQVFRLHHQLLGGATSSIIAQSAKGRALTTQFLVPMPPGEIVRLHNGRQYVASGKNLRWSPALRYGMTDPARNIIHFNDEITMLEPVGAGGQNAGIFVGLGRKTIWLAGVDPSGFSNRVVHSAGVIPGSSIRVTGQAFGRESKVDVPVWVSRAGYYVIGNEGGSLTFLKEGEAVINDATRAATLYRQEGGIQQLVTAMRGTKGNGFAVSDRLVGHVIHADD